MYIDDCICLTSKAINMLHTRTFVGNLALKMDKYAKYAKLFISFNGKTAGYFSCHSGGAGQTKGSFISYLFCISEEVITRDISNLVNDNSISLMIFCKVSLSNVNKFQSVFKRYTIISGQQINLNKFSIHTASISIRQQNIIDDLLWFSIGFLRFSYLGIPIFKRKPTVTYIQSIVYRIKGNSQLEKHLSSMWQI